jgi:hypothetical protein
VLAELDERHVAQAAVHRVAHEEDVEERGAKSWGSSPRARTGDWIAVQVRLESSYWLAGPRRWRRTSAVLSLRLVKALAPGTRYHHTRTHAYKVSVG